MMAKHSRIGIFLGIALIWSFIWFSQKHQLSDFFNSISPLVVLAFGLIPTFGLLIGSAIINPQLPKKEMSLLGGQPALALLIFCTPLIGLSLFGVTNSFDIQPNLFGVLIGLFTLTYALMEEIGWRGYLQEEFMGKNQKWMGYIFIGVCWYLWHWYFLRSGNDPKLIMLPILIAASLGIGEIAKSTKSVLICGAVHGLVNILLIYPIIANQLSSTAKIGILGLCLLIWIPLIRKIEKQH